MTKWISLIPIAILAALSIFGWLTYLDANKKNVALELSNTELNAKVVTLDSLVKDKDGTIATLHQMAYTKTFNTERELANWAKNHISLTSTTYYSEDAVNMVNEARLDGYWMGFLPVHIVGATAYVPIYGSQYAGGYIVCLAIVDGATFYMVDPTSGSVLQLMNMQAEFKWREDTPGTQYKFN